MKDHIKKIGNCYKVKKDAYWKICSISGELKEYYYKPDEPVKPGSIFIIVDGPYSFEPRTKYGKGIFWKVINVDKIGNEKIVWVEFTNDAVEEIL